MKTISVVIPTYRRAAKVQGLLDSIFQGTLLPDEVIVVDNDPDSSWQATWPRKWPVRILRAGLGLNLAGARNRGWQDARGDLCLFIDDDNTVAHTTLNALLIAAGAGDIGLAAPVMYESRRPTKIWCAGVKRSMWTTRTMFLYRGMDRLPDDSTWQTDDMPNALAIPRTVLEAVGGFDELHFPFYYDEGDIAQRIRTLGLRLVVVRDASVWHSGGTDSDPGVEMIRGFELGGTQRVQAMAYARVYFHRRHSHLVQKGVALTIFMPMWAFLVIAACLRRPAAARVKRDTVTAILAGLVRGYSRRQD